MIRLIWCTLIGLLIGSPSLSARERPRWELGILHAAGQLPHYTGSNHYYQRSINLPYGILRSEQIDVSGVPRLFTDFTPDLRLEMAFGAELPVESDDLNELPPPGADGSSDKVIRTKNYTRRGMEDIQALIGIGLTLDWYLGDHVTIDFPLLSKSTLGGGFRYVGNSFAPGISVDAFDRDSNYALALGVSWEYGDENFNRTYYEVKADDALPGRPTYSPSAGLISRNENLRFVAQVTRRLYFFALQYRRVLENSVVRDSPLVVVNKNEGWAFGIILALAASDASVTRRK